MEEHDRGTVALVEVGEPQALVLAVGRLKREVGKPLEQLVGGACGVGHRREPTSARSSALDYGPSTIACAASDATVTSITLEKRSHAIRFSAWSRSSIAWNASACERRT